MFFGNILNLYFMVILFIIRRISAISYNRPKFCPNATWNPNATTLANSSIIGAQPYGLFVTRNNTVYASGRYIASIEIWANSGDNYIKSIPANLNTPLSIFVTDNGNIYVDNGHFYHRVDLWKKNVNHSVPVMYVNGSCAGLFIDLNNTLYCSMWFYHQVIQQPLDNVTNTTTIAAGTGYSGFTPDMLNLPCGIVVDFNFRLFIADCGNNRIQRFEWGQLNGTTVAGNGTVGTVSLNCPVGIALDADGYLFIVDRGSNRVFGSNSYGFRCLLGCWGAGAGSLNYPETPSFDSDGNMFLTDGNNNRIQKFSLATNSCFEVTTSQSPVSSTKNIEETTTMIRSTSPSTTALSTILVATELSTYITYTSYQTPSASFIPPSCPNATQIGIYCNISSMPCDILKPCQNNGNCINTNGSYICICPPGFNGAECQIDNRPCQPNTCWNNGNCTEVTNETFHCRCTFDWTGIHCETKINYCHNITCLNNGVCRPLLGDYKCECLGDSFSGRHCEVTSTSVVVRRVISKSFAYIGILAMAIVIGFIVIMDILKYGFGIDPTRDELERIRREKRVKRAKRPVIIRYTYVNAPAISEQKSSDQQTTTV